MNALKEEVETGNLTSPKPVPLAKFLGTIKEDQEFGIPFNLHDYIDLVHYTGRAVVHGKKGRIPDSIKPVLTQIGINPENWVDNIRNMESRFYRVIGAVKKIRDFVSQIGQLRVKGISAAKNMFRYFPHLSTHRT